MIDDDADDRTDHKQSFHSYLEKRDTTAHNDLLHATKPESTVQNGFWLVRSGNVHVRQSVGANFASLAGSLLEFCLKRKKKKSDCETRNENKPTCYTKADDQ